MGLRLLEKALRDIDRGVIIKNPQQKEFSTFEPNADVKDLYKPDLLMLEAHASPSH
jgi:methionyl-tRNA formyltransferase